MELFGVNITCKISSQIMRKFCISCFVVTLACSLTILIDGFNQAIGQGLFLEEVYSDTKKEMPPVTLQSMGKVKNKANEWKLKVQNANWVIICKKSESLSKVNMQTCRMETTELINSKKINGSNKLPPISIYLEKVKLEKDKKQTTIAIIKTPIDVLLAKGLTLKVDKLKSFRITYRSCHIEQKSFNRIATGNCIAPFIITRKMKNLLKKGQALRIQSHSLSGKIQTSRVSLKGFIRTLDNL